jgi:hypothetical protein
MSRSKRRFSALLTALSIMLTGCGSAAVATSPTAAPTPTPLTILSGPATLTPTPTFPPYTAGAWAATPAVGSSGILIIYGRFEHDSMPVANVPATIAIATPFSATITYRPSQQATGSDGMVAYTLTFTNLPPKTPVTVTITFSFAGQTYAGNAFFANSLTAPPAPAKAPATP